MSALRSLLVAFLFALSMAPTLYAKTEPAGDGIGMSEGVEGLIQDLSQREREIVRKELEIAQRERSIGALEEQVELRLLEIEAIRAAVEKRIKEWEAIGGDHVARLSKVYSAMPPEKSAALLQKLEQDLATAIMGRMKDKVSAAILAQMPRNEALRISRQLASPLALKEKR